MISYTLQRLLQAIPVLMMISLITFFLVSSVETNMSQASPASPLWSSEPAQPLLIEYLRWFAGVVVQVDGAEGGAGVDTARCARLASLDLALCDTGGGVVRADLGTSAATGQPVWRRIVEAIPATLGLAGLSFGLGSALGLPLIYLGHVQPALARLVRLGSGLGRRISLLWLGLMILFLFGVHQARLTSPAFQVTSTAAESDLAAQFRLLVPATSILALFWMALLCHLFAGDGLGPNRYLPVQERRNRTWKQNLLVRMRLGHESPETFIAATGAAIGHLLAATVIVETLCGWPGLGRLTLNATMQRDYPVVLGIVMVTSSLVLLGHLLIDVACIYYCPQPRPVLKRQVGPLEPMQK